MQCAGRMGKSRNSDFDEPTVFLKRERACGDAEFATAWRGRSRDRADADETGGFGLIPIYDCLAAKRRVAEVRLLGRANRGSVGFSEFLPTGLLEKKR